MQCSAAPIVFQNLRFSSLEKTVATAARVIQVCISLHLAAAILSQDVSVVGFLNLNLGLAPQLATIFSSHLLAVRHTE